MYLYYNVVLYVLVFLFHFPHLNTSKPSIEGYMLWFHFVDPNCVDKYLICIVLLPICIVCFLWSPACHWPAVKCKKRTKQTKKLRSGPTMVTGQPDQVDHWKQNAAQQAQRDRRMQKVGFLVFSTFSPTL